MWKSSKRAYSNLVQLENFGFGLSEFGIEFYLQTLTYSCYLTLQNLGFLKVKNKYLISTKS